VSWIGVDLDGTLAHSEGSHGKPEDIGEPIPKMHLRVKHWLHEGRDVRIFTARAFPPGRGSAREVAAVEKWCKKFIGEVLPVTCMKDPDMKTLYDDRAVQVEVNSGELVE
jgi:hypothetical protein